MSKRALWLSACLVLLLALLASLALFVAGRRAGGQSVPLDQVLMAEIERWGGKPVAQGSAPAVPALRARWTVKRDNFGTVLETGDLSFQQVDGYLRRAFGPPSKAGVTGDNHQQWVIPAKVAGTAIWYSESGGGIRITVSKPLPL